jgi:hypothetical protein
MVPVVLRITVVQRVPKLFVSEGLTWGCHRFSFISAGYSWPTPPRCVSVPSRQHPPHVDNLNFCYFFVSLHTSMHHRTGHIRPIQTQPCQLLYRSLLTPKDSALSFQLSGSPALEIGPRPGSRLHPIVPSHLQMASGQLAMTI